MDEGYIKFKSNWKTANIEISSSVFGDLQKWRSALHKLSLIGVYKNGIGYGNISCKNNNQSFFITGSATGGKKELELSDYSEVTHWDFGNNNLDCIGKTVASSESMTHAAIYNSIKGVGAVIHVHSQTLWQSNINRLPTTSQEAEYGTPEMAYEIIRLAKEEKTREGGIIVMGGHEEGILAFGRNIDEAGNLILDL